MSKLQKYISREEEEAFDYDDYAPEAAALMKVEILDLEEKTGPSLGRVLGAVINIIFLFHLEFVSYLFHICFILQELGQL